jgi:hypothetical protein
MTVELIDRTLTLLAGILGAFVIGPTTAAVRVKADHVLGNGRRR